MVVCRFFMQGSCKYGNNCWNEHPTGAGYSMTAQRQLFGGNKSGGGRGQGQQVQFGQNRFKWISPDVQQQQQNRGGGGTAPVQQQLSSADIVRALATEVKTMFEDGKMWPFTCIGFEKELASLPGFNDISMEEMRVEAYEAQKSGNTQPFEQKFRSIVNEVMEQREQLKTPNLTLKQKLIEFIDEAKKKKNTGSTSQGLFTGSSSSTLFGGAGNSGGLFGSSQTSGQSGSGLFGQKDQSTGFGQSGQQSVFGQPAAIGQSSTFGQAPSFGQSTGFGQSNLPQTTTMFGQNIGQSGGGQTIFGQTTQTATSFAQPQTPKVGLFGKSESPLKTASFQPATGTSQSFFGSSTPQTSQALAPVSSLFGGSVVPAGSGFGSSTTGTALAFGTSGSGFGSGTAATSKPPVQAQHDDGAYTPLDKLSMEDLEQFRLQTFTMGKIPIIPPPRELCFDF